jgi:hypothetical protein
MKPYLFKTITKFSMVIPTVIIVLTVGHARASESESDTAQAYTPEDCIECHRMGSEESGLQISVETFNASVHGEEATCLDCHTGVVDDEHESTEGSGAVDCGECHEQENRHGGNGPEEQRPLCHDCHSRHNMLTKTDPASSVHPEQLPATCAGCHAAASGETGFFSWFPAFRIASHNKADFAVAYEKDNCLGCHQGAAAHGESEPINAQECQKCHFSKETAGAMWGDMHPIADRSVQPAVFAAASIYQLFIVIGLFALLGKFLNLFFNRVSGERNRPNRPIE